MASLLQGEIWVVEAVNRFLRGDAQASITAVNRNAYVMAIGNVPVEVEAGGASASPVYVPALLADSKCFVLAALTEDALDQQDVRLTESWEATELDRVNEDRVWERGVQAGSPKALLDRRILRILEAELRTCPMPGNAVPEPVLVISSAECVSVAPVSRFGGL